MHQITGFPAARTDQWVVGGNATLTWTGSAPEFNSSGAFTFPNVADVTCGGLQSCNVTVTVSGVPAGWYLWLAPVGDIHHLPAPNGSTMYSFGTYPASKGWYNYIVEYTNYPLNGTPPITVTWSWTA